jgi:hypothetical protein
MIKRRSFLLGLGAIAAPAIIRIPGLLMPIKPFREPFWVFGRDQYNEPASELVYIVDDLGQYRAVGRLCWLPIDQSLSPLRKAGVLRERRLI